MRGIFVPLYLLLLAPLHLSIWWWAEAVFFVLGGSGPIYTDIHMPQVPFSFTSVHIYSLCSLIFFFLLVRSWWSLNIDLFYIKIVSVCSYCCAATRTCHSAPKEAQKLYGHSEVTVDARRDTKCHRCIVCTQDWTIQKHTDCGFSILWHIRRHAHKPNVQHSSMWICHNVELSLHLQHTQCLSYTALWCE